MYEWVTVNTEPGISSASRETRVIAVYKEIGKRENESSFKFMYSLQDAGGSRMNLVLADGITELQFYEVCHAAEMIDNFNQYFNTLNQ